MSMDKELKETIIELSEAQRMIEEEGFHGDNIAGAIEVNEGIEDNISLLKKLQSRLRGWTAAFTVGLITLIIILLYMLFASNSLSFFMGSNASPQEIEVTTLVPDEPVSSQPDEPTPPETTEETTEEEVSEQKINEIEVHLYQEFETPYVLISSVQGNEEHPLHFSLEEPSKIESRWYKEERPVSPEGYDCHYMSNNYNTVKDNYLVIDELDEETVTKTIKSIYDSYFTSDIWFYGVDDDSFDLMRTKIQESVDAAGWDDIDVSDIYTVKSTGEVPETVTLIKVRVHVLTWGSGHYCKLDDLPPRAKEEATSIEVIPYQGFSYTD